MPTSDTPTISNDSLETLTKILDNLLPQTQCRQCGTEGCLAYARAMARGEAPINRCAPGGQAGINRIATFLGIPAPTLDPEYGQEMPFAVARIRAEHCIGCSWCIKVCPTDAIAGAPKHLHGVLEQACTGCALCLPACPMDCIDMVEVNKPWTLGDAHRARGLYHEREARREKRRQRDQARLAALSQASRGKKTSSLIANIMAKAKIANQTSG